MFFRTVGAFLPPPAALAEPPGLWGSEAHVESLFVGTGIELEFERDVVASAPFESTDAALEFLTAKFEPMMMARQLAEASARWPELRAELETLYERDEPLEDLVTIGRKEER